VGPLVRAADDGSQSLSRRIFRPNSLPDKLANLVSLVRPKACFKPQDMQRALVFKKQALHIPRMHTFRSRINDRSVFDANHRMRNVALRSPSDSLAYGCRGRCKDDIASQQARHPHTFHVAFTVAGTLSSSRVRHPRLTISIQEIRHWHLPSRETAIRRAALQFVPRRRACGRCESVRSRAKLRPLRCRCGPSRGSLVQQ
jgi:hypothetical protein